MSFVNTLPYISNPIEEFKDFKFISWERDIYPKFKGGVKESEARFFLDLIRSKSLKNVLDLGVGGGTELCGIIELARAAAHKAALRKENVELPPMNAYERRIVHMYLSENPQVKTESRGVPPLRQMVIIPVSS